MAPADSQIEVSWSSYRNKHLKLPCNVAPVIFYNCRRYFVQTVCLSEVSVWSLRTILPAEPTYRPPCRLHTNSHTRRRACLDQTPTLYLQLPNLPPRSRNSIKSSSNIPNAFQQLHPCQSHHGFLRRSDIPLHPSQLPH